MQFQGTFRERVVSPCAEPWGACSGLYRLGCRQDNSHFAKTRFYEQQEKLLTTAQSPNKPTHTDIAPWVAQDGPRRAK